MSATNRSLPAGMKALLSSVILLGIAMRLWGALAAPSLWLDEVFSAQLAQSPLIDLLMAVPRFDTHPPLYYLQLHFWALIATGDGWLLLNSVLLDVLVILSLLFTLRRIHDPATALWAAALWAVAPLAVFFAGNLRMYALLFLLLVWLWYVLERRVRGEPGLRLAAILLGIAVTLTHGLGFFVAFFVWFQAFVRSWQAGRGVAGSGGAGWPWRMVLDYVPVAACALYPLGIGLFRQTEGMEVLEFAGIGIHLAISLLGMQAPAPVVTGYLAAGLILLPLLFDSRSRGMALWLLFLPWAVLLGLSLGVKAVFMYRTLGLFLPFLVIAMALLFAGAWQRQALAGRLLSGVVLVLFAVAAANSLLYFEKQGYRNIAAIWQQEAAPDAVLFVQGPVNLWGISRYLDGVAEFSALEVQPPVRDGMARVKDRLQGSWFDRAGLFGRQDHLLQGARQIWPYLPETMPDLPGGVYWALSSAPLECLRDGDTVLRRFDVDGQRLFECGIGG